jgi:hypothetical protein
MGIKSSQTPVIFEMSWLVINQLGSTLLTDKNIIARFSKSTRDYLETVR